uniref:Arsenate reductase n=1 Tax=Candidatus Kentrum sp. LFY TaxID=2126342 RepID=A0A450UJE7_9GAMM|nr:MAG: arsenate reductase [Candidatus Kentron sp. LFY]
MGGYHHYNALFLCTGNSARSILAESLLEFWGEGRFGGFSAGSHPTGEVNPLAIELLREFGIDTMGLRSKSWDEFARPDAPKMDFVFTVCGKAAGETCPVWIGEPMKAHWGVEDPASAQGTKTERMDAFRMAFQTLEKRIKVFTSLPIALLSASAIQKELNEIGEM